MRRDCVWIVCMASLPVFAACRGTQTAPEPAKAADVADAAIGKPITTAGPPNVQYQAEGVESLVDGRMGSDDYQDPEWMGWWYEDKPFVATIDLGKTVAIKELGVHTLTCSESWIFYPRKVEFELSSDGKTYEKVATIKTPIDDLEKEEYEDKIFKASNLKGAARYVRVRAERYGKLPDWHAGSGGADGYEGEAWLFIDEILVNPRS